MAENKINPYASEWRSELNQSLCKIVLSSREMATQFRNCHAKIGYAIKFDIKSKWFAKQINLTNTNEPHHIKMVVIKIQISFNSDLYQSKQRRTESTISNEFIAANSQTKCQIHIHNKQKIPNSSFIPFKCSDFRLLIARRKHHRWRRKIP